MKRLMSLFFPGFLLFFSTATLAAQQAVTPGSWEFEIKYNFIGLPQTFPGYTMKQCVSESTPFPSILRPENECQMQLQGHFANTYTWTLNCSDDWEMVQGMGRIRFNQGLAHGDVHLQVLNPHNPPQMMEFRIQGRRTGACEN